MEVKVKLNVSTTALGVNYKLSKITHRERHLLGVVIATARPGLALLHDGHQHRGERHIIVHFQPVGAMSDVQRL